MCSQEYRVHHLLQEGWIFFPKLTLLHIGLEMKIHINFKEIISFCLDLKLHKFVTFSSVRTRRLKIKNSIWIAGQKAKSTTIDFASFPRFPIADNQLIITKHQSKKKTNYNWNATERQLFHAEEKKAVVCYVRKNEVHRQATWTICTLKELELPEISLK